MISDSSHIHRSFIKQELFDADIEDAVVVVPRNYIILDHNDFLSEYAFSKRT